MNLFSQNGAEAKESDVKASPDRVINFVRRVIRGEKFYPGPERRANLRYPLTMPVKVTPLDKHQEPIGQSFLAVTRDISVGGMCLYHMKSVREKYLQLELSSPNGEQLQVVMEVVRCRQAGPFYEIAGPFIGYA